MGVDQLLGVVSQTLKTLFFTRFLFFCVTTPENKKKMSENTEKKYFDQLNSWASKFQIPFKIWTICKQSLFDHLKSRLVWISDTTVHLILSKQPFWARQMCLKFNNLYPKVFNLVFFISLATFVLHIC